MSELTAAAGLAMLDRYEDVLGRRRSTAVELRDVFSGHPLTYQRGSTGSTWPSFPVLLPDAALRRRALELAARLKIEVGFDSPLHRHPAFAEAARAGRLEVTELIGARILALPMANSLGPRQVVRLAELASAMFDCTVPGSASPSASAPDI
jgi:dTDP-4-amino-4,6-dideoxygalactose transaminase